MRGRKPKPAIVKQLTGNPGKRPIPTEVFVDGRPVKPAWLIDRGAEIWGEVLSFAYWLTRADSYVLAHWCEREAQHESPRKRAKWKAADRRQHTSTASELGLTQSGRTRMAIADPGAAARSIAQSPGTPSDAKEKPTDPAAKYLN